MENTTMLELHLDKQTVAGIVIISALSATVTFLALSTTNVVLKRINKQIALRVEEEKKQKEAGND